MIDYPAKSQRDRVLQPHVSPRSTVSHNAPPCIPPRNRLPTAQNRVQEIFRAFSTDAKKYRARVVFGSCHGRGVYRGEVLYWICLSLQEYLFVDPHIEVLL